MLRGPLLSVFLLGALVLILVVLVLRGLLLLVLLLVVLLVLGGGLFVLLLGLGLLLLSSGAVFLVLAFLRGLVLVLGGRLPGCLRGALTGRVRCRGVLTRAVRGRPGVCVAPGHASVPGGVRVLAFLVALASVVVGLVRTLAFVVGGVGLLDAFLADRVHLVPYGLRSTGGVQRQRAALRFLDQVQQPVDLRGEEAYLKPVQYRLLHLLRHLRQTQAHPARPVLRITPQ